MNEYSFTDIEEIDIKELLIELALLYIENARLRHELAIVVMGKAAANA